MHKWRLGKSINVFFRVDINSISIVVDLRENDTKFVITKIIPSTLTVLEILL